MFYKYRNIFSIAIFSLIMLKIVGFYLLKYSDTFSSLLANFGNDSEYYDAYARGAYLNPSSVWPVLLRYLYEFDLYNRETVSFVTFFVSLFILPFVFYKAVTSQLDKNNDAQIIRGVLILSFVVVCYYPTLVVYSTDLNRDIYLSLCLFLFTWALSNFAMQTNQVQRIKWGGVLALLVVVSFGMRPYLGFALFVSLFIMRFSFAGKKLWLSIFLFLMVLVVSKYYGLIDPILLYRGEDGFERGGSSLGIGLVNLQGVAFTMGYLKSFFVQLFGLYFVGSASLVLFTLETLPFIYSIYYVIGNRKYLVGMPRYIFIFFVVYTSIWTLGNDNIGTAVRLRTVSYLAIYMCALFIYGHKNSQWLSSVKRNSI